MSELLQGTLGEFVSQISGGGTPARDISEYWSGDIPWVSVKDLASTNPESTAEKISEHGLASSASRLIPAGIPIVATRMAVGRTAAFSREVAINQDLKAIFPNEEVLKREYLLQFLKANENILASKGTGSTVKGIRLEDLEQLPIAVPPLHEQKKITEILSGLDKEISLEKGASQKLISLQRAIIQDAFDKLTVHGSGKTIKSMGEVCEKIFVGIASSTTHAYTDKAGVAMLRNQNIKSGVIDDTDLVYISHDFSEENNGKKLLQGDVITARTGYPGASAVIAKRFENCHSFTTLISRVKKDLILPEFYALYMNSPQGKAQVSQMQAGGAQENLNVGAMEKMTIPVPSIPMQRELANIADSFIQLNKIREIRVRKQEAIKLAISSDLLSGRKRVSI